MNILWKNISRQGMKVLAILLVLTVMAGGGLSVHTAQASKTDLVTVAAEKQKKDPTLILTQGMAEIVDIDGDIADIMVADPSIVDVMALQSNRLYVVGVNLGSTNIIAVNAEGDIISRMNVHVKFDDVVIQNLVDELFPDEEIKIRSLTDQAVVTGRVSTSAVAEEVINLVAHYAGELQEVDFDDPDEYVVNMLRVAGEHQVMLRVKIVEASRGVLKELGVETNYTEPDDQGHTNLSLGATAAAGLTSNPFGVASLIYNNVADRIGPLQMIIRALEEDGMVNTLAEPNLTAVSGEAAGFLAGGELPVPTGRDKDGNLIVEYRPFGVSLNFEPVVMDGDLISLHIRSEVSSISDQNSLTVTGVNIPGFTVRRAETTVEMGSGGSLMIAGLLESNVTKGMTDLPGIKNVPILGDLMSSESYQRNETELIIVVTAYLVQPYADKTMADVVDVGRPNPLAQVFADNMMKMYKDQTLPSSIFGEDERYGYLID